FGFIKILIKIEFGVQALVIGKVSGEHGSVFSPDGGSFFGRIINIPLGADFSGSGFKRIGFIEEQSGLGLIDINIGQQVVLLFGQSGDIVDQFLVILVSFGHTVAVEAEIVQPAEGTVDG